MTSWNAAVATTTSHREGRGTGIESLILSDTGFLLPAITSQRISARKFNYSHGTLVKKNLLGTLPSLLNPLSTLHKGKTRAAFYFRNIFQSIHSEESKEGDGTSLSLPIPNGLIDNDVAMIKPQFFNIK